MTDTIDQGQPSPLNGPTSAAPRRINGRAKRILLTLVVVAAIGGGLWFVRHQTFGRYQQQTDDARIEADMVTIAPRVAGNVTQLLVSDNQYVRAGQPLVHIDPRDSRAKSMQADAQIKVALAQRDAGLEQVKEQQAAVDQARAQLSGTRIEAAYDAGEVMRLRPLAQSGAEPVQRLAQLEATARKSADSLRAQQAALEAQQRHVATLYSQVRQAEAQAESARAQRDAADIDVGATVLRAPVAGRIGNRTVRIGQYVQAGTRLMSIVPVQTLYVTANFKETQLALMRPGQPVTVRVDALDGMAISGRVASLAPGTTSQFSLLPPQNATGNFTKITQRVPVRITIAPSAEVRRLLVPGLSVDVTVDTLGAKGQLDQIRQRER